jgi:hypothetical protein
MAERVQDIGPFAGHSPQQERPLGGYAVLMGVFGAAACGFAAWFRASGRELPERMEARDLALVTVATHKASRLLAKDRVTSTVRAPFTRWFAAVLTALFGADVLQIAYSKAEDAL